MTERQGEAVALGNGEVVRRLIAEYVRQEDTDAH